MLNDFKSLIPISQMWGQILQRYSTEIRLHFVRVDTFSLSAKEFEMHVERYGHVELEQHIADLDVVDKGTV